MCFRSHIHLAGGSQEVGTHDARLPIATPRRAFWIGGNGSSSLRAQTLGHLTSNVPERSFNIQPRTAYTRSELDPPTLHCGSPMLALATTHISTRGRGGAHRLGVGWIDAHSVPQPRGRSGIRAPRKSRLLANMEISHCIQTAWPLCSATPFAETLRHLTLGAGQSGSLHGPMLFA